MHLPKATRRQLVYATAAVLVTGGALLVAKMPAAKPAVDVQPRPVSEAATLEPDLVMETLEAASRKPAAAGDASMKYMPKPAGQAEPEEREKVETYTVVEGDTIETIAARFGLKSETLLDTNELGSEDILSIGQELLIPKEDGIVYEIRRGDNLWLLAEEFGVDYDDIVTANPDLDPVLIHPGQQVLIPGGSRPVRSNMLASRGGTRASTRGLAQWPAYGETTSDFGWRVHPVYGTDNFHDGVDFDVAEGTPLVAASGGTVTMAGRYGGYGIVVRIDHGNGLVTQYAHMSQVSVSVGEKVAAGQHIGYSGNTGVTTGPHLHFMVMVDGTPADPMPWLP